ncbi:MAG: hypothetical protein B5M55_03200 [Desulfococcus sp. 4484_242]|nr:MAG: hypothetical protein B5M55_03200 [Desulfococcus sp. 4484_242]
MVSLFHGVNASPCLWDLFFRLSRTGRRNIMKSYQKAAWVTAPIFLSLILACVTINIYFPAEKVESVAGEIVDEIRGQAPHGKESLFKKGEGLYVTKTMTAWLCRPAWAEEPLTVSNPTIRALKDRMKTRYARLRPFYAKGMVKEENSGYVSLGNTEGLGLKEKRDLKALVNAENKDRRQLYLEVAKALKIDPGQVSRVAEIFAKQWQKSVP